MSNDRGDKKPRATREINEPLNRLALSEQAQANLLRHVNEQGACCGWFTGVVAHKDEHGVVFEAHIRSLQASITRTYVRLNF